MFFQIEGEVLHPLRQEEAERPAEAQDDHEQQLPREHQGAAVEERHCCKHRLAQDALLF